MRKAQRALITLLSVCVPICLAGREDRLAHQDDLEQMLRDLENVPGKRGKKPPLRSIDHALPDAGTKANIKEDSPPKNSAGDARVNEEDVLDEIAKAIEKYRHKENANTKHASEITSSADALPYKKTFPLSTTAKNVNQEAVTDNPSESTERNDRKTLLKQLMKLLESYKKDRTSRTYTPTTISATTGSATTTSATPTDTGRVESLEDEALDLAFRAVRLFLHLYQD